MTVSSESLKAEEDRLREAYARRKSGHLYSHFNPAHLFMVHEREKRFLSLLYQNGFLPLSSKRILEIGCGRGELLRDFVKWGARPENVVGVELLADRVSDAVQLCPAAMRIVRGNAVNLDLPNESFDLVVQSTVFTSVLDHRVKSQMASEMMRILKPDGLILWYDYHMNNPYNPDVRGVKRAEICELFAGSTVELKRITLAPPLARMIAPYSWMLCYLLGRIPFLCTHYIGVMRKTKWAG